MDLSKLPKLSDSPPFPNNASVPDPGPRPPIAIYCTKCGAPLHAQMEFCGACGAKRDSIPTNYQTPPDSQLDVLAANFDLWFSLLIGVIMLMFGRTFGAYLLATIRGQQFHTNVTWQTAERAGQEVSYWQLQGYSAASDAVIFLFGLFLLLNVVVLLLPRSWPSVRRYLFILTTALIAIATLGNLFVAVLLFAGGAFAIYSIINVFLGGYILSIQLKAIKSR